MSEPISRADAVVLLDAQALARRGVPYENFNRMIHKLHAQGLPSACVPGAPGGVAVNVDYMSDPAFRRAMGGFAPVVQNRGIVNMTQEAAGIKRQIDDGIRQSLDAAGVRQATATDAVLFPFSPHGTTAGLFDAVTARGAKGFGCP